ncbi:Mobile element protein [Salipiger mucosus DSM 16094]|uniref:Mobile element protein n=1 Tax=Salipiger mucosus DSM 16094 TaxID=1123237 RepID=S9Q7X4_9RHOB|nr:Mobile element protein [Salipiger mucosus DSM 16094]
MRNRLLRRSIARTRDLLVDQRTQLVNALRGHLAEHGIVLGKGIGNVERLAIRLEEDDLAGPRPASGAALSRADRTTGAVA